MTMKQMREAMRAEYIAKFVELFGETDEVLQVKSNEFALPVVLEDGTEDYVVFTVKMPTGARDGAGYDGHLEALNYQVESKAKAEAKAEREAKKQAKIAKDLARKAKA